MCGGKRASKRGWALPVKLSFLAFISAMVGCGYFGQESQTSGATAFDRNAHGAGLSLLHHYTRDWQKRACQVARDEHVVTKDKGKSKGRDHINGIEGFWCYAKDGMFMCRSTPKKSFHPYLPETPYRFNHQDEVLYPLLHPAVKATDIAQI